jgi:hypothetical protein
VHQFTVAHQLSRSVHAKTLDTASDNFQSQDPLFSKEFSIHSHPALWILP